VSESAGICNRLYALARECNGCNVDLEINGVPALLIQRLEDADRVLRLNAGNYHKNMPGFRQALGPSRFTEDGRAWEIRQALSQAYFNKFDREATFRLACRYGERAARRLIADSAQGAATLREETLREMAVSVLIENFFGLRLEDSGIDLRLQAQLMEFSAECSFMPAGRAGLSRERLLLLPALRLQVMKDLHLFRTDALLPNPMLEGMLAADADPANDFVLEHELLSFLAAGAETTAATVGWACHLLAQYPQAQERLRALVTDFWTRTPTESLDWAHLGKLEALTNFISETLRLFPTTPFLGRLAVAADRLGEHDVAPGQNVLLSIIGIQHDERLHPDPWQPDWDGSMARGGRSGIDVGFSFGPRICGGKRFALVELAAFLATFIALAHFESMSDEAPRFHWKSLMLREGGQRVRVRESGFGMPI
jgi:cytochrome P450